MGLENNHHTGVAASPVLGGSLLDRHDHFIALVHEGLLGLLMGPSGHRLAWVLTDKAQRVSFVQSDLKTHGKL